MNNQHIENLKRLLGTFRSRNSTVGGFRRFVDDTRILCSVATEEADPDELRRFLALISKFAHGVLKKLQRRLLAAEIYLLVEPLWFIPNEAQHKKRNKYHPLKLKVNELEKLLEKIGSCVPFVHDSCDFLFEPYRPRVTAVSRYHRFFP